MPLPRDMYRRLLPVLTNSVLPHVRSPALLSDFLARTVSRGGLEGVLALHGLFVLVTQHGFEYPAFYQRLYNLLTPQARFSCALMLSAGVPCSDALMLAEWNVQAILSWLSVLRCAPRAGTALNQSCLQVFTARHRLKFLQLTDVFLASSLVPAYTVAAFAKRFARLALTAPPAGAAASIGFIHNLLRRHPSCTCLLHQPHAAPGEAVGQDVYDASAQDPAGSRAIESSLWELAALQCHQDPMVLPPY